MTADENNRDPSEHPAPASTSLPFDPADLVAMRVLPAEFSRMVGVSKQAVSQWVKKGIVTLGPDGRLDPKVASRQVIDRTDPSRLRARVFREATADRAGLMQKIEDLEKRLEAEHARSERCAEAVRFQEQDKLARREYQFMRLIVSRFEEAQAAHDAGRLEEWLENLSDLVHSELDLPESLPEIPEIPDEEPYEY